MGMVPFHTRFRDLALSETRTVDVLDPDDPVPMGSYGFFESYCDDRRCDCRRALIHVVEKNREGFLATISFGFDDKSTRPIGFNLGNPFLDPINPQSELAPEFLELFKFVIEEDPAYVERLKRHYAMFKDSLKGVRIETHENTAQFRKARRKALDAKNRKKR